MRPSRAKNSTPLSARATARLLVIALVLTALPIVASAPAALACGEPPKVPIIKTIWGKTGGPKFVASLDASGEIPTQLSYTYSYKKASDADFGSWSEWVDTAVTSFEDSVVFTSELKRGYDLVAFSANATNECGNRILTISRQLVGYEQLSLANYDLASDMPLAANEIPYLFFAPGGYELPQTLSTQTPEVCAFTGKDRSLKLLSTGKCEVTISQNNDEIQTPNPDVTRRYNIVNSRKILPSVAKDRPDDFAGSQIHVVYVTLTGVPNKSFDQRGDISNWLDLTNIWMKKKLGKEFAFDTFKGSYDVSYMKSKISGKEVAKSDLLDPNRKFTGANILERLKKEFVNQAGSQVGGKYLLFVVDAQLSKKYCGLGQQPGRIALMTPRGDCWNPKSGYLGQDTRFNSASKTIAHELIHNIGVGHPCADKSDLMIGSGCSMAKYSPETTLDVNRKMYVGTAKAGANILKAKFWKK